MIGKDFKHRGIFKIKILRILIFLAVIYIFPWKNINWGSISIKPASTITVQGSADKLERSQIANFTASVSAGNEDKEKAVDEVNVKMEKIISEVKNFGIDEKDIKTQNVSVYKREKPRTLIFPAPESSNLWTASNSISITLRDVDKAGELADLLSSTEATGVNGPSFSLDDTKDVEAELLKTAIENARLKAEKIADASNGKLGDIINVVEGSSSGIYRQGVLEINSSGTPVEPGSQNITKTVTVTFEIK